ncbi:hypothetical protein Dip510_000939 [Elusimicrobium posterum]|uniref:hypothetical protein n=1 Tax=Elusimicrobium posterum TaxID=3116653 RepID=UPI003C77DEF9
MIKLEIWLPFGRPAFTLFYFFTAFYNTFFAAKKYPKSSAPDAALIGRFLGFLTTRIKTVGEILQPYQFLYSNMSKTTPKNTNRLVLRKGAKNGKTA